VVVTWALGLAADVVDERSEATGGGDPAGSARGAGGSAPRGIERGPTEARARLVATLRRVLAGVLVFHYVCLAWIFFRATSFENALAILRQLAKLELDHANLVPLVAVALAAGFAALLFADGSFRWLRDRFVALPSWAQGAVLAASALVLRALGQPKLVPFIYFQF
jgi:hypothetical protein